MEEEQIQMLKNYLTSLEIPPDISKRAQKYLKNHGHKFVLYRDVLYRFNPEDNHGLKKVLNEQEAHEAFLQYHMHPLGGHFAHTNTLFKINMKYYWPNMSQDILQMVKTCPHCQLQGKKVIRERLNPIPVTTKPFYRIGLDVKHVSTSRMGSRYIVAAICYLTKYVEARPLQFQTTADIGLFIYEDIICRYGVPAILHTDNGKPMISNLIYQICRKYNIIHKTITVHNSQSQGMIERFNRVIDQTLQRLYPEQKQDWDSYISACLFAYRSIKQETTKQSPFFMLFGYEPITPFDNALKIYNYKEELSFDHELTIRVAQQIRYLNTVRTEAHKMIEKSQKNQKKRIDQKLTTMHKELKPPFKLGDIVLLYRDQIAATSWSGKIQPKWEGPYIIHLLGGKGTYFIKPLDCTDALKVKHIHGNRLKKYSEPHVAWNPVQRLYM